MPTKTTVKRWWEQGAPTVPNYGPPSTAEVVKENESWGFDTQFYRRAPWLKFRALVLKQEPLCRHCSAKGRVVEAKVLDHIIPRSQGGADLDRNNVQPLCKQCHSRKTRADFKKYGKSSPQPL